VEWDSIPLPVPLTTHTRTSQTGHPLNHRTIIRIPTKKYIRYILATPINNGATSRENNKIILFVNTEATPLPSLHNYVTIQLLNNSVYSSASHTTF
jgi:hypothetical protein